METEFWNHIANFCSIFGVIISIFGIILTLWIFTYTRKVNSGVDKIKKQLLFKSDFVVKKLKEFQKIHTGFCSAIEEYNENERDYLEIENWLNKIRTCLKTFFDIIPENFIELQRECNTISLEIAAIFKQFKRYNYGITTDFIIPYKDDFFISKKELKSIAHKIGNFIELVNTKIKIEKILN